MTDPAPFEYRSNGRSLRTGLALAVAWALILLAWWGLNAAPWVLVLPILATLPAIWDLWQNPAAGLRLTDRAICWFTGKRSAEIAFDDLASVRLDRRFDLSLRVSAVLISGKRIRVPAEATPPAEGFEAALDLRGIKTERHPFSLF